MQRQTNYEPIPQISYENIRLPLPAADDEEYLFNKRFFRFASFPDFGIG
jgi:hypothetical protein